MTVLFTRKCTGNTGLSCARNAPVKDRMKNKMIILYVFINESF